MTGTKNTTTKAEEAKPVFVVKDIVQKKKTPQQKMERYFPVTKPKVGRVEKNFQGYPITECRYEEEVEKHVYRPSKYYKQLATKGKKGEEAPLCTQCFLRPCIVKGRWNEIMNFCEDVMVFENDDSDEMYFKMMNHAESIVLDVFGPRYWRNHPNPTCINELVGRYHDVKREMEEQEEQDPDEDLVAGAIDRFEEPE